MKLKPATLAATLLVATAAPASDNPIQSFLIRGNYLANGKAGISKALQYRVQHYTQIRGTTFMGLGVSLHKKTHGPLRCVERAIREHCEDPYQPQTLSGWRPANTYRGAEVSNHLFGIALDIDPGLNPCCGCKGHWAKVERCQDLDENPHGRYELPECWIGQFEKNGWYWLGHDPKLRDTMHFEYLGKPGAGLCAP